MKRKVVQLNYILSFIFNFVLHIYIATFRNSVALSHIGCSNLNFWWLLALRPKSQYDHFLENLFRGYRFCCNEIVLISCGTD